MKTIKACLLPALLVAGSAEAAVPDRPWFVHIGAARLDTDEAARVRVLGMTVPGADVRLTARYSAAAEIGRFLTPGLAIGVSAGLPLKQPVSAAGSIAPYGRLGRITYGPAAVTAQWHPLPTAVVQPYLGAGVSYMHVFSGKDAAVRDFRASDDVGPVVQGGIDVPLGHALGLFADVKKAWLRTTARGSLAGAPVEARIRVDPLILHTGVSLRF